MHCDGRAWMFPIESKGNEVRDNRAVSGAGLVEDPRSIYQIRSNCPLPPVAMQSAGWHRLGVLALPVDRRPARFFSKSG